MGAIFFSSFYFVQGQSVPIRWSYWPAALAALMVQAMLTMLHVTHSYQLKVAADALFEYLHQVRVALSLSEAFDLDE